MILTVPEAAERLGVDPSLVRAWCRRGRIEAQKHGRDWGISETAMKQFEESRTGPGRPGGKMREEKR